MIRRKLKGEIFETVICSTMMCGLETTALTKWQKEECDVAEMIMLCFSMGVTRLDELRIEQSRETIQVGLLEEISRWAC